MIILAKSTEISSGSLEISIQIISFWVVNGFDEDNQQSIVLKVTDGVHGNSILLPADFESAKDWHYLDMLDVGNEIPSSIFKMAHHGGRGRM